MQTMPDILSAHAEALQLTSPPRAAAYLSAVPHRDMQLTDMSARLAAIAREAADGQPHICHCGSAA